MLAAVRTAGSQTPGALPRAPPLPRIAQINNAGIFDMGTKARKETADGYESHFGTNFMAPSLLTLLLLPYIRAPEGEPFAAQLLRPVLVQ